MPFSDFAKDNFMAPHLSEFQRAEIPDMSKSYDQSQYWLDNFILNSMLRVSVTSPTREFIFTYLRHAVVAFEEHALARTATYDYLSSTNRVSAYFSAIHHWSAFLGATWHALELTPELGGAKTVFAQGSGTVEERVNHLYNRIKHTDKAIRGSQMPANGTVPVWLTNEGLTSTEMRISFEETARLLNQVAEVATELEAALRSGRQQQRVGASQA